MTITYLEYLDAVSGVSGAFLTSKLIIKDRTPTTGQHSRPCRKSGLVMFGTWHDAGSVKDKIHQRVVLHYAHQSVYRLHFCSNSVPHIESRRGIETGYHQSHFVTGNLLVNIRSVARTTSPMSILLRGVGMTVFNCKKTNLHRIRRMGDWFGGCKTLFCAALDDVPTRIISESHARINFNQQHCLYFVWFLFLSWSVGEE